MKILEMYVANSKKKHQNNLLILRWFIVDNRWYAQFYFVWFIITLRNVALHASFACNVYNETLSTR